MFSGQRPTFYSSDHIEFRKPVPLGSVAIFSSQVSYASGSLVQVCPVVA